MFWSKLHKEPLTQSEGKIHWEETGSLMAAAEGQGNQEGSRGQPLLLQRTAATAHPEDSHSSSRGQPLLLQGTVTGSSKGQQPQLIQWTATGLSRPSRREASKMLGLSLTLLSVRKGASGDLCPTSHMERAEPSSQILIGPAVPQTRRN